MEIIVDLQGFVGCNDEFIVKELAIASVKSANLGREIGTYLLFKPPCRWNDLDVNSQQQNIILMEEVHGLSWGIGTLPYYRVEREIRDILREERVTKIYVLGDEKKKWLHKCIGSDPCPIINLESYGCPSIDLLKTLRRWQHFNIHQPILNYSCAFSNVGFIKKWFEKNWGVWCPDHPSDAPSFFNMEPVQFQFLEADFLYNCASNIYIDDVWDKLREDVQKDKRISSCRRCKKHFNFTISAIDGPIPMIKDCGMCQMRNSRNVKIP